MNPVAYVKIVGTLLLLSAVFWGGCSMQKNRDAGTIAKVVGEKTELERKLDKQAKDHAEWIAKQLVAQQAELAGIDKKNTEDRARAKKEYEHTIADLRAGNLQLHNRFVCPKVTSPATASTGVDNAETPTGLQVQDAEFFVSESERADEVVRQLTAAQEVIESLLKQRKP